MPYIKGRGVRDLYLIRIARIGTKAEVLPKSEDTEPRLVFDLEYLESLPDYVPVTLQYLRTYRDTVLGRIYDGQCMIKCELINESTLTCIIHVMATGKKSKGLLKVYKGFVQKSQRSV